MTKRQKREAREKSAEEKRAAGEAFADECAKITSEVLNGMIASDPDLALAPCGPPGDAGTGGR